MTSGSVFDIKRFALHDGPGLRTTVFLKGCPLSCQSCHNPEGQATGPELILRSDRCTSCGDCVPVCPQEALTLSDGRPVIRANRCALTGACAQACLPGALEVTGRWRTVEEILAVLERDRIYYDESGGGVTISGGEPMAQPEFLRELLLACRDSELHVVLDTCGHAVPPVFQELASLASGLLFDLKVMDEARHEAFTGTHNRWILENLRWAAAMAGAGGLSLTVRLPLVPGINDDVTNLRATASFLAGLDSVPPVDILPYHRLGVDKYTRLGRDYTLPGTVPPDGESLRAAIRILEAVDLAVTVRGEPYGHD